MAIRLPMRLLIAGIGSLLLGTEALAMDDTTGNSGAQGAATSAAAAPAQPVDPVVANDPEFMAAFDSQYTTAWGDGAIPAKYKELSGVTLSVVIRCEGCIRHHVRMAVSHGATRREIAEAMRLGLVAGGSAGIPTMRQGYQALDESERH